MRRSNAHHALTKTRDDPRRNSAGFFLLLFVCGFFVVFCCLRGTNLIRKHAPYLNIFPWMTAAEGRTIITALFNAPYPRRLCSQLSISMYIQINALQKKIKQQKKTKTKTRFLITFFTRAPLLLRDPQVVGTRGWGGKKKNAISCKTPRAELP